MTRPASARVRGVRGRAARGRAARGRAANGRGARGLSVAGAAAAALLAGCGGPHSAFADPASDAAAAIGWLWWVLLAVSLGVFLAVLGGWAYAVFRRRGADEPVADGDGRSLVWILVAGALVPAVILLGLTVATIRTSGRIAGAGAGEELLVIEVVGHQFWWEARYPGAGAVTANEIHVPAGRAVRLRLTSNDVIHSVWIPRLQGKLDMTPGRTTELVLHPEEPGIYRGFCAEFCGDQHALMGLRIVAQPEAEFQSWLAHNAAPAAGRAGPEGGGASARIPTAAGEALFTRHECNLCHRVRGASFDQPESDVGPDLTHLASRRTLGAVTLENTPANLAAWILDPHAFKPGVRMPATPMPESELRTLVRYLEGLQ